MLVGWTRPSMRQVCGRGRVSLACGRVPALLRCPSSTSWFVDATTAIQNQAVSTLVAEYDSSDLDAFATSSGRVLPFFATRFRVIRVVISL